MQTIFLSYAHGDNDVPPGKDRQGWVTFFERMLRIELDERGLTEPQVKLWRDRRDFDYMNVINDTLIAGIKEATVFLAVLSPLYSQRQYTLFELQEFFKDKLAAGIKNANELVLLVLKRPLPEDRYPPPVRGMAPLPFFEIDRETNDATPFFEGFGESVDPKYWKSIRKVGDQLERRLGQLAALVPTPAHPRAAVYLAASSADLAKAQWAVRNELESQGCRIVPGEQWPNDADAARQYLHEALDEAQFSIHLLGATSGSSRASGLADLSRLQLDLAAELASTKPGFRRLIWLPDKLQPTEAAQGKLIADLEDAPLEQDELVRSGLEAFKEVIRAELAPAVGAVPKPLRARP